MTEPTNLWLTLFFLLFIFTLFGVLFDSLILVLACGSLIFKQNLSPWFSFFFFIIWFDLRQWWWCFFFISTYTCTYEHTHGYYINTEPIEIQVWFNILKFDSVYIKWNSLLSFSKWIDLFILSIFFFVYRSLIFFILIILTQCTHTHTS